MTGEEEKETTIILVRHGVTEWNRLARYQGRLDIPLNEEGRKQSFVLAQTLKDIPIAAIFTSPLRRAYECAGIIATVKGAGLQIRPGLTEICHGVWEGLTLSEVESKYADLVQKWRLNPYDTPMPQGESIREVEIRAWETFEEIASGWLGKISLIITHDVPLRTILRKILNLESKYFWRLRLDNVGINVVSRVGFQPASRVGFQPARSKEDSWQIVLLNDTCHLGGWLSSRAQLAL